MEKPSNLLLKLSRRLFAEADAQEKFIAALTCPQPFHPCILWCRQKPDISPFATATLLPWQPDFIDRLAIGEKPGQHPLHAEGFFYCLDFSSAFAASALLAINATVDLVVDACAAPGGKSVFAWRVWQPKLTICNEVIGKRLGMLISNLKRCQIQPSAVLNRDVSILAQNLAATSQVVLVDAPCTGQSLLAKGDKAPGCFHPSAINKSANRQKRIIANSAQIVAPNGFLAYMTCTYSPEENEEVCAWFLDKFPQFQPVSVSHLSPYQSHLTTMPCYRMWPQDRIGAGAFVALFANTSDGDRAPIVQQDLASLGAIFL